MTGGVLVTEDSEYDSTEYVTKMVARRVDDRLGRIAALSPTDWAKETTSEIVRQLSAKYVGIDLGIFPLWDQKESTEYEPVATGGLQIQAMVRDMALTMEVPAAQTWIECEVSGYDTPYKSLRLGRVEDVVKWFADHDPKPPTFWVDGIEYDDGGLPVHLYPFPVDKLGRGPAAPEDTDRVICWCGEEGCQGNERVRLNEQERNDPPIPDRGEESR